MTLEVAGGIFTWNVMDPEAAPRLHLWSPADATWLWRIVGEQGHVDVVAALAEHRDADVAVDSPGELAILRRLAWGHWLRRWWPASVIDGIEELPRVVLDIEVALLTDDCEAYFDEVSFDGDPHALLAAHGEDAIGSLATHASAEVRALHGRWIGREGGAARPRETAVPGRADDYALAAGSETFAAPGTGIAQGRASVAWESVPANTFDAAENTIAWSVDAAPEVVADVAVALLPGRAAIPLPVTLSLPDLPMRVRATLEPTGLVRVALPLTAAQAWRIDWSALVCAVGETNGADSRGQRNRVRSLVRRRIGGIDDGTPLFVAERLVADADY
ncbi:hypothetical protein GOARA_061_00200 [Gordonia araii NBRC 100433]|uniref:Uncharacterized protein n=2 Tax=Gordonia araii TaxID=263909 RepID=G7H406_9ACTN|nr:hypothetical protein [Gordonia araii]GAB10581.1 hypothetical protein GOARA_061_00200 [Gordonia araii NBRC 100433]